MNKPVAIVGAGLAGSEAVWQLASRNVPVSLFEMRPHKLTEAHTSGGFAELVCSNSFKSTSDQNAHGLLKAEMDLQNSLVLEAARMARVPAGQALAVDRQLFSAHITHKLKSHPLVTFFEGEVSGLEELLQHHSRVIVASGPLTSPALTGAVQKLVGSEFLYFYDAIAPVIAADSINREIVFQAARYGKGDADYLNCPMNEKEYRAFVQLLLDAEKVAFHHFETERLFEGCLPIEAMAQRGPLTLAYGPMKPVGFTDPRTKKRPFAVVQLRQENLDGSLYSMVGFQTKMTWPEQQRVFRTIPGLEQAEFARLGSMHRNTFINSPGLLDENLALKSRPRIHFAGQVAGVEGYMESAAMGLYAGRRAALLWRDQPTGETNPPSDGTPLLPPPPPACTMTGALLAYILHTPPDRFQPINSSFGLLEPLPEGTKKNDKKPLYARRALEGITQWNQTMTARMES
ncbi:MAG: methylenetetrahydrofolate--tRNA-(uracil(54)-C(5))-methyltransferase (FADH(2)-oxidizing) TrmFO [Deltaproteobacteria bacterium]|nr:methylenetetrahydrofolate--tRNA-(uracil(54)-C(5))-methyltransferase (FADH(2)-oxidizing) TrmFO [Deltaproteobacteria bacterium]